MRFLIVLSIFLFSFPVEAALNVLACTPEWGSLAKEIGGEKATVYVATTALQDPHHIEERPSLIARARSADLLVCTGAELEVGWVPLLQSQSGNAKIQAGRPGYFEAASAVTLIEKPGASTARWARSMPAQTAPASGSAEIVKGIVALAGGCGTGPNNGISQRLKCRWREATARWGGQAALKAGVVVITRTRPISSARPHAQKSTLGQAESREHSSPPASRWTRGANRRGGVAPFSNEPRAAVGRRARAKIPAGCCRSPWRD